MKRKYDYIKNPIFQVCLVLLITSCGSGGGGSNAPRSITPTKIISKNPEIYTPAIENPKIDEIEKPKLTNNYQQIITGVLPNLLVFSKPTIPQVDTKGENLIVGILDSNFLTHRNELEKKYGDKITILEKNENNYTDHGELVLDTLLNGISPKIVAASLSSKYGNQDIIKFSLDDYKKILTEMKKGDSENNKKVKIFNQSWGSTLTAKDEREIYADKKRFREELLKAISLKTTGNIEDIYNSGKESLTFYEEAINTDNALFIWSNGNLDLRNQTLSNAGLQAAAPMIKSNIEKC